MSHSTHVGFSGPLAFDGPTARPSKPFTGTFPVEMESPVSLWSLLACGVGHFATAVRRFNPPSRPDVPGPPVPSDFVGVGHEPESVSLVRGANG
jgi:hypothetical protein